MKRRVSSYNMRVPSFKSRGIFAITEEQAAPVPPLSTIPETDGVSTEADQVVNISFIAFFSLSYTVK